MEHALALLRFVWAHPETRHERGRAIRRVVACQVWQRCLRRPRVITLAGALRLKCYPHSTAASGILYTRYPEWRDMHFVEDFLEPGDWFFDVGANVGVYSLLAASNPGVHVLALEPSEEAAARAEENVSLNGLGGRVTVLRKAAGPASGKGRLSVGLDTMNRLLSYDDGTPASAVDIASLDDVVPADVAPKVALVKIDVEGAEVDVLRGATRLLEHAVPAWIVEANDVDGLERIFASYGYEQCAYDPATRRLGPAGRHAGQNLLFVHSGPNARARCR